MRKLTGFWNIVVLILSVALVVFHLYTAALGVFPDLVQRSIHLGFVLTMTFILVPPLKKKEGQTTVPFYDIALALLATASTVYLLIHYKSLIWDPLQWLGSIDVFFAVAVVFLVLEASRRTVGLIFPGLALFFYIYAVLGPYFPGMWGHQAMLPNIVFQTLYHSTNGIWGQMVGISAGMLAMFGIFGAMLSATGGAETFVKLGQKLTGKAVGGQGKVALIASGLFGMISGSPMANVVGTGTFTIPLMKRSGYDSEWSAAISAVGSTGGTIMPPMMGAGAFIMAQILGISYLAIARAAILPAVLYYAGAFVAVHYISKKSSLSGANDGVKIQGAELIVIFVPIALFLFFLFRGYTATVAAFYASVGGFAIALCFLFAKEKRAAACPRILWNQFSGISVSGAKSIVSMASLLAGSQITITLISLTGFGVKLSDLIISIGQDHLILCLLLSMLVCIILGMGLPVTASYVLGSAILVPALTKLGIDALVAHLFVFYFSGFSTITPPVCAAVYLSAGLAKANWLKTGFLSCMIALPAFIIPYTFVYDQSLLLAGSIFHVGTAAVTAFIGVYAVGVGVAGFFVKPLSAGFRIVFILAGILMVIPNLASSAIGFVMILAGCLYNALKKSETT